METEILIRGVEALEWSLPTRVGLLGGVLSIGIDKPVVKEEGELGRV